MALAVTGGGCSATRGGTAADSGGLSARFASVPLSFVENKGQIDGPVSYYVQGRDASLYFGSQGVTFALSKPAATLPGESPAADERWAVKLDFVGAAPVAPTPRARAEGVVSYFEAGPEQQHLAGLATYSSIAYENLWPGIDMVYSGTGSELKYSFVVHPGADPSLVRLAYRGAAGVALNAAGQIEVSTPAGGFTDDTPYTYQDVDGRRVEVASSYALDRGADGTATFAIPVGGYDTTRDLVIDPVVLVYAGFLGGAGQDNGDDVDVDADGNAYVTGQTSSLPDTFPVTVGPYLTSTGTTAFVAKVRADGTGLDYAGYIEGTDFGRGIAVDDAGHAYVTGSTGDADLPASGGLDPTFNGVTDAFVVKVNPAGTGLVYAGYIGGAGGDSGWGIAIDSAGSAYVGGQTGSNEATFPVTVGPDLTYNGSFLDAFVAKVDPAGSGLVYAGYVGGDFADRGWGIAVDSEGSAYLAGETQSTQATFPVTVGPDLTHNAKVSRKGVFSHRSDAFVAKVTVNGSGLAYAGFIGGAAADNAWAIAVDGAGAAYVVGDTSSHQNTFPVTRPAPDRTYNGFSRDGFIAKVSPDGTGFVYAGFIGSDSVENLYGVTVDTAGAAYVTGAVGITSKLPTDGGFDDTHNGSSDAFVVKVNPQGSGFEWGTFLGGTGGEFGRGIALDGAGNVYVAGSSVTSDGTFPATSGLDQTFNGGSNDAFVAKIAQT